MLDSFAGKDVNCLASAETENDYFPYDAIVIPGAGMDISPEGFGYPNEFQKLRLVAAAIKYIDYKKILTV